MWVWKPRSQIFDYNFGNFPCQEAGAKRNVNELFRNVFILIKSSVRKMKQLILMKFEIQCRDLTEFLIIFSFYEYQDSNIWKNSFTFLQLSDKKRILLIDTPTEKVKLIDFETNQLEYRYKSKYLRENSADFTPSGLRRMKKNQLVSTEKSSSSKELMIGHLMHKVKLLPFELITMNILFEIFIF